MQHAVVTVSGQVQGVGFRFTTRRLAQKFDVSGYVMNLPDGRVRMEAEGREAELDAFFNAVKVSRLGGGIRRWEESRGPARGLPPGFDIRY